MILSDPIVLTITVCYWEFSVPVNNYFPTDATLAMGDQLIFD